jgi:3-isopropylmalate/(R)-2-methylmalate dehydratase small subunit
MKEFKGNVLFLDRSDINTDEIIPARYLTEIEKIALKPHLLEDLKIEGFDPKKDIEANSIIVTRENFGCGSSREHAPWALEVNGIHVVIAVSFARIFRQNMFNCGMPAIELLADEINEMFHLFSNDLSHLTVDMEKYEITIQSKDLIRKTGFGMSSFDRALIQTGGWVEYADRHY